MIILPVLSLFCHLLLILQIDNVTEDISPGAKTSQPISVNGNIDSPAMPMRYKPLRTRIAVMNLGRVISRYSCPCQIENYGLLLIPKGNEINVNICSFFKMHLFIPIIPVS